MQWLGNNNVSIVALPLAARTGNTPSADISNPHFARLHVLIEATGSDGGFSVTPRVEAKSLATGAYYPILIGDPITTTGTRVLKIGPGLLPKAKKVSQDFVPNVFRIKMEHADPTGVSYAVTCTLAR